MLKTKKISSIILYSSGVLAAIIIWCLASNNTESTLHRFNLPDTVVAFGNLMINLNFWKSTLETLQRLFIGLGIAIVLGVPIGILTGYFSKFHQFTYVTFQFLRNISPLSWTPVAIILFGIGSQPVYFLVSIAAIWPIIINTAAGVQSVDKQWIEVAKCLGADDKGILKHILIRGSLPSLMVGIQLAFGVAWLVIVPAEMLGVSSGLGYMILDFRDINEYPSIMAVIVAIGLIGIALDIPLRKLIKKVSWD